MNLRLEVGGEERVILTPQKMRLEFAINVSCECMLRVFRGRYFAKKPKNAQGGINSAQAKFTESLKKN